jgi:hypothetical protein
MLILAMPKNTNNPVYKTPIMVNIQTIKNIIDPFTTTNIPVDMTTAAATRENEGLWWIQ